MILVSLIGDSLSTFEGFNPSGYSVFYNADMQKRNGLSSVYDTWWAKVNQAIHAYLCVNNSYSGSRVTGDSFPAASCKERISCLRTADYTPDIILIYIGFNDFGNGVGIRRKKSIFKKHKIDLSYFEDAYAFMLDRIKEQYPYTKVVCGTLMRTRIRNEEDWCFPERYAGEELEDYNDAIRRIVNEKKVYLADIGSQDIRYETLDGTHPTLQGHQTIADAWIKCLAELDLIVPSIETCIKMYQANKNSDLSVYMVFQALSRERVLAAFDKYNNLMGLPYGDVNIIPVFTSPNEIGKDEPIIVRPIYLRDITSILISSGKNIIVNPFSATDIQFIIPHDALSKMLKPLIDEVM